MKTMNMKISVITPSYNQGDFIERTIKSVLSQKGDFHLEYIIIDGNSTDNTLKIIKKYENLLNKNKLTARCSGIEYRWISEPDKGQANALNKGFKIANGEIIGWLNSDDTYTPDALQKAVKAFSKNRKADVVFGNSNYIDKNDKITGFHKGKHNISFHDFRYNSKLVQPEVFFRKKLISKIGFLDETLNYAMDYEFWIRALKSRINFKHIPFPLANFRLQNNSKTCSIYIPFYIESLTVRLKYFGLKPFLAENLGTYSAGYSEKTGIDIKEAFLTLKDKFTKKIDPKQRPLADQCFKNGLGYAYLNKGIYKSFKDKKSAFGNGLFALLNFPRSFFSKSGIIFLARMLLNRQAYFFLKNFL
ncbi:MAG: glycosyltransferase family 2 protein [bacterium]|nr:glycosyltransferase family 2 protein [bacterium]